MGAASSAWLLAVGATWRLTGLGGAGAGLVTAVATGGETERTLAGMLLTRAGDRSVPVVATAMMAGRAPAELAAVLAGIDTPAARAALTRAAEASRGEVSPETRDAAEAAVRTLDEIHRREG
ncbi:MAG: hypothetical protein L0H84_06310 [Pseudonocardia sp.]|nr:hypothetical protein [Pseudonocardia sp.]